ncbi:MAG: type III secretion protein [Methylibium sp. NZG]|nr:MAG: type III secretion protein [Methylibium sp. NZG]
MADPSAQDRNLPASQRKLDKAREDGQVARSRDLGHFAALAVGAGVLLALAPQFTQALQDMLARALRFKLEAVSSPAFMLERLSELVVTMLWVVLPAGVLMSAVALGSAMALGGWNWTWKPLQPKFDKLNPITGLPRIFAKQQLVDALKASLLALILGAIGALYLNSHLEDFAGSLGLALPAAIAHASHTVFGGLLLMLLALAVFAAIDAPLQKWMHANQLKMSQQEMKEEHKELEGNVEIKHKIKQRMREMANRRMLAAVPTADLVVMNPTHYAVALKYDDTRMGAPRVVAKGADLLAMTIRDAANDAKVPVLQAAVLARALYAHAEIDREIPAALFAAVAQVLAYVYQLRAALAGRSAMPGELPELNVPAELDPHHKPPPSLEDTE